MKETPWYPGSIKPVRDGVYKRRFTPVMSAVFSKFKGGRWHFFSETPKGAARVPGVSACQNEDWCGLAEKQKS